MLADLIRELVDDETDVCATTSPDVVAEAVRHRAAVVVVRHDEPVTDYLLALSAALQGIALAAIDERGQRGARYVDGRLELTSADLSPEMLRTLLRAS